MSLSIWICICMYIYIWHISLNVISYVLFYILPGEGERRIMPGAYGAQCAYCRCMWKNIPFTRALAIAIHWEKLLSSPWVGTLKAFLPKGLLFRRSVFSQTLLWQDNILTHLSPESFLIGELIYSAARGESLMRTATTQNHNAALIGWSNNNFLNLHFKLSLETNK